jgi:hypothetical protein
MLGRARVLPLAVFVCLIVLGFITHQKEAQAFSCSQRNAERRICVQGRLTHSDATNSKQGRFVYPSGRVADSRRVNLLSSRGTIQDNHGASSSSDENNNKKKTPIRSRLRQMTGFSLTAFRATMRAATGISMTALYASSLAFSGEWIRQTMKVVLSIFPAWARYFVQPILILYYLPLFTLRNLTGPNRRRGFEKPHALVDGWNQAIVTADNESLALWEEVDDEEDDEM